MWGSWWWDLLLGLVAGILLAWAALIVALVIVRPRGGLLRESLRLLPDLLRLLPRLAADRSLPRRVRAGLALLLAYLAFPFDLVPDFIPVLGYADDAIIVAAVLRWVVRQAGAGAIRRQWRGTDDGFAVLCRLAGLTQQETYTSAGHSPAQEELTSVALADDQARRALLRRGYALEYATLAWNVAGIVVLAIAAVSARSVALAGFALDSLIEIGASTVVIWELSGTGEQRQRRGLRLIGYAFAALAAYLLVQSTVVLATSYHPHHSVPGIIWTAATAAVMFALAAGKARTGGALGNPVLRAEGRVTLIDGILATAVLLGLVLNASVGWWWADPAAGYVLVCYAAREVREIFAPGDHLLAK